MWNNVYDVANIRYMRGFHTHVIHRHRRTLLLMRSDSTINTYMCSPIGTGRHWHRHYLSNLLETIIIMIIIIAGIFRFLGVPPSLRSNHIENRLFRAARKHQHEEEEEVERIQTKLMSSAIYQLPLDVSPQFCLHTESLWKFNGNGKQWVVCRI